MKDLIRELLPHAPQMGLYVEPHIPETLVHNAVEDYAKTMPPADVVALFDATLLGNAKDGALFAADRFVFQNTDLEPAHDLRYEDLVRVEKKRGFIRGAKVLLMVNRGRATFELKLDCSARPKAMEFIFRFLHEAMLRPAARPEPAPAGARSAAGSDLQAVQDALRALSADGRLAPADHRRMLDVLETPEPTGDDPPPGPS